MEAMEAVRIQRRIGSEWVNTLAKKEAALALGLGRVDTRVHLMFLAL